MASQITIVLREVGGWLLLFETARFSRDGRVRLQLEVYYSPKWR